MHDMKTSDSLMKALDIATQTYKVDPTPAHYEAVCTASIDILVRLDLWRDT